MLVALPRIRPGLCSARAKKHFDQTGKSDLEDEDLIKDYLVQMIGVDELENEALGGILWLCLHIQKCQFSTDGDVLTSSLNSSPFCQVLWRL